jgi:tetratricopeptide (TPR) repeat protein
MPMNVGERLADRWEIRKVLRGGQGEVYIVYDHQERMTLAAKTPRDDAARKEVAAKRFAQEARTWIFLDDHPNIVRAFFLESIAGRPYLFLEYVPGGTLGEWIAARRLGLESALYLAIQFCRGMEHANARGMTVHRDIKPANCLMTADGTLKISDFGLVRVLDSHVPAEQGKLTRVGAVLGTPMYLAPEQFLDSSGVDVRADIYSTGIMVYEMFAGHMPFTASPKDVKKWFQLHLYSPVPPLEGVLVNGWGHVAELDRIIGKCVHKIPDQRYKSYTELREDLEAFHLKAFGRPAPVLRVEEEMSTAELCNKAFSLGELGKPAEEAAILAQVLDREPRDPDDWIQRGAVLARLGDASGAQACFSQASLIYRVNPVRRMPGETAKPRKALTLPTNLSAADNAQVQLFVNIARVFVELHRAAEAVPYLESVTAVRPNLVDAWLTHGRAMRELGKPADALGSLDKALALDTARADVWLERGIAQADLERYEEAIDSLGKSLRIAPTAAAWLSLGNTMTAANRFTQAIMAYEKARAIAPDDPEIWSHEGMCLAKAGNYAEAVNRFTQAERLGDPRAAEAIAKMQSLMSDVSIDVEVIED